MAKKSKRKNNNSLIWLGIALTGIVASIIGMFLNIFSFVSSEGGDPVTVKLFSSWPKYTETAYALYDATFHGIWATLFEILIIVAIALVVVSIICKTFVKKADKLAWLLVTIAGIALVIAIVCGLGFSIINTVTGEILETTIHAKWAIGAYLMAIGGFVGVAGAYKLTK